MDLREERNEKEFFIFRFSLDEKKTEEIHFSFRENSYWERLNGRVGQMVDVEPILGS